MRLRLFTNLGENAGQGRSAGQRTDARLQCRPRPKLDALEKKYDGQFRVVFDAIRELMTPEPIPPKRQIGFKTDG